MPPMRLPYFPLHTVVFPHLPLPIHVFELAKGNISRVAAGERVVVLTARVKPSLIHVGLVRL